MNRSPYMPDAASLIARLPDMGAALDAALCELGKDMTVDRIDQALMKLKGAEHSLVAMRRVKIEEARPGHGSG